MAYYFPVMLRGLCANKNQLNENRYCRKKTQKVLLQKLSSPFLLHQRISKMSLESYRLYEARRKYSPKIRCYFSNVDIFNGFEILLICLTMIKLSKNRFLRIQKSQNFMFQKRSHGIFFKSCQGKDNVLNSWHTRAFQQITARFPENSQFVDFMSLIF